MYIHTIHTLSALASYMHILFSSCGVYERVSAGTECSLHRIIYIMWICWSEGSRESMLLIKHSSESEHSTLRWPVRAVCNLEVNTALTGHRSTHTTL